MSWEIIENDMVIYNEETGEPRKRFEVCCDNAYLITENCEDCLAVTDCGEHGRQHNRV